MNSRLHPAADAELIAAAQWYEARSSGLGERFLTELVDALTVVDEHPRRFPRVQFKTRREIRRCTLRHFPYAVIYEVRHDTEVVVVAIAHAKRRPNYWRERLC